MTYKGYTIAESSGGGKAGAGRNKTATIQVRELLAPGQGYLLKAQFRFNVGDDHGRELAIEKAKAFIDRMTEVQA